MKQAFDLQLAATIERSEKQVILAHHARRLLKCLDDTPVIPGDVRRPYDKEPETRQIVQDAENDLNAWQKKMVPVENGAGELSSSLLATARDNVQRYTGDTIPGEGDTGSEVAQAAAEHVTQSQTQTQIGEEEQSTASAEDGSTIKDNAGTVEGVPADMPGSLPTTTTEPETGTEAQGQDGEEETKRE